MRRKYELQEKPICNVVNVFRERGNYLQRLELFEKAILAYNEALLWNGSDVKSLLGRSLARVKATHYDGALKDAVRAADLSIQRLPDKLPLSDKATIVLLLDKIRECTGKTASSVLEAAVNITRKIDIKKKYVDENAPNERNQLRRTQPRRSLQVQYISRPEKQKAEQTSRLMASKYLERMAHDKYFLRSLCKDERLISANKQGSIKLQELSNKALADLEKRQDVLRERRPMYAASVMYASEAASRARLSEARKNQITHAQLQHTTDARRLIQTAQAFYEERETNKCLESAEFGMEQISRKPISLLPGKDKYLQELYCIVSNAFLDQKRVRDSMSESDRERRAFILLGMVVSREPSHDSVIRARPPAPPRDVKSRISKLERALTTSTKQLERCYILHELARLHVDTRHALKARYYAHKCQTEAKASGQRIWALNGLFLLARTHLLQNNRPEARAVLLEATGYARLSGFGDIAEFFDTCVNVSVEGEVIAATDAYLEKRQKDLVNLMQGDDLKSEARHLFKRMSLIPAARRFSIMPGTRADDHDVPVSNARRRQSIIPKSAAPTRITFKSTHPLGFIDFDR